MKCAYNGRMRHPPIAVLVSIAGALFVGISASMLAIYDDWKRRRAKRS